MADREDVERFDRGEIDLTGCDFRELQRKNVERPERDFERARLNHARFEQCAFPQATFVGAVLNSAEFIDCDLSGAKFSGAVYATKFRNSNLRKASFQRSQFTKVDFSNCDLRRTDFRNVVITDDNSFDGVTVDETTDFEGARLERSLSRLPIFRFFEYQRGGTLKRRNPLPKIPRSVEQAVRRDDPYGSGSREGWLNQGSGSVGGKATGAEATGSEDDRALLSGGNAELDVTASGNAEIIGEQASRTSEGSRLNITGSEIPEIAPAPTVASVAKRIEESAEVFARLSNDAADRVSSAIERLDGSKPNEPDTLERYETVRQILVSIKDSFSDFSKLSAEVVAASAPSEKSSRAQIAAEAAMQMYDGFASHFSENGWRIGRVLAQLGLIGTCTGLLSYVTGAPSALTFTVVTAAVTGNDIWEAVNRLIACVP